MHKTKVLIVALLVGVVSSLAWAGLTHAQAFRSHVPKKTTIDSSLYSTGNTVNIQGTINGDIFCAGKDITINATVNGDVLCAGQNVTIAGQVYGDIRAAGQKVTIKAQVSHNATVLGQDIKITSEAKINQDLTTIGSNVRVDGIVGRDLVSSGTKTVLANEVGRNVKFDGNELVLLGQTRIEGDLTYKTPQAASIPSTAEVVGDTKHQTPPPAKSSSFLGVSYWGWMVALMFIVFGLFLVLLFPKRVDDIASEATKHLGKTLLVGLLVGGTLPFMGAIAIATVVGLPIGLAVLFFWVLLMLLSGPIAGYYLGSMILSKSKNPILIMLLGATLLFALYLLPVIGFFAIFVGYWIGAGAILLHLKHHTPKPVYKV